MIHPNQAHVLPPTVTTVLFDIDNTLIPTHQVWQRALADIAADLAGNHLAVTAADIVSSYTRTSATLWGDYDRALAPLGSHTAARKYVWQLALQQVGIDMPERELTAHAADFAERQLCGLKPDLATSDSLRRLARTVQLGVITNGDTDQQHAKLVHSGLAHHFRTVVCALGNSRRKPDPAPFQQACAEMAVRPEQCLYVGDEWATDVVGARNVGMHPVWISPAGEQPPVGAPPTARFSDLASCLAALCDHATNSPHRRAEPT
ncbi:HAD family hydrolase [Streptomyces lonarensis]|uniref:HAD family hydrolase n=1 Tax=Streptomyces lonarensis TaxID=700599 RepID=A0A7X6HX68_9ACTN|nr:HAD family hydrolase [Streptomyces lonarensis]NJQ04020.1 HAD family hydrolase [Streptomyces lonarensis]